MGYGYGVWLVYNNTELKTEHIGHITIACFMNKDNAFNLYRNIFYFIHESVHKFSYL